jgi:hypothetical protein
MKGSDEYNSMSRTKGGSYAGNFHNHKNKKGVGNGITHKKSGNDSKINVYGNTKNTVTAPYNFIPLPDKAIDSPLGEYIHDEKKEYKDYITEKGKLNGTIEYTITTLTPTYVGGDKEFFAPNGRLTIPGSTMRGLIKNMLKIVSCGTMRDYEDLNNRYLYFRSMFLGKDSSMLKKKIGDEYKQEIGNSLNYKGKAGFLVKEKDGYKIYPAECVSQKMSTISSNKIEWHKKSVDCYVGDIKIKRGEKSYYTITFVENSKALAVDQEIIESYRNDENRNENENKKTNSINILEENEERDPKKYEENYKGKYADKETFLKGKFPNASPCFYVEKNGKVQHFGFCKFYRVRYKKSISDHIPDSVRNLDGKTVDFSESIFGNKENWAGRVFFGDSIVINHDNINKVQEYEPKILLGPNPTSFQLYLDQRKALSTWNGDGLLRGYKLYWHQKIGPDEWKKEDIFSDEDATDESKKESLSQEPIKPVPIGTQFSGKMRFTNLSAIELGALLRVFELGNKGHFKIGRGKPLGMGSINLDYKVNVIDNKVRYSKLFDGAKWNLGVSQDVSMDIYVKEFNDYIISRAGANYGALIDDLQVMLAWEKDIDGSPEWKKQLQYMPQADKRYENREILPTPKQVIERLMPSKENSDKGI